MISVFHLAELPCSYASAEPMMVSQAYFHTLDRSSLSLESTGTYTSSDLLKL
jgi:hypothetical protein